jgi:hypothetical protein
MAQKLLRTALPIIGYSEDILRDDDTDGPFSDIAATSLGLSQSI